MQMYGIYTHSIRKVFFNFQVETGLIIALCFSLASIGCYLRTPTTKQMQLYIYQYNAVYRYNPGFMRAVELERVSENPNTHGHFYLIDEISWRISNFDFTELLRSCLF